MKKLAYMIIVFMLSGCAAAMPVKQEDMTYQKVVEISGVAKDVIFEKSKQWIAHTFKSAKAVIEYDNREEGVIIGNGSMERPISAVNISGGSLISYTMQEDIKDGRVRLTFSRFAAQVPPSYNSITGTSPGGEYGIRQADLQGMRSKFNALSEDLQQYTLNGKAADNW